MFRGFWLYVNVAVWEHLNFVLLLAEIIGCTDHESHA